MESRNPITEQSGREVGLSEYSGIEQPSASGEGIAAAEPYVGPRPFNADDQRVFFGRNREISEIASLVLAHPIVLVYGGCGTGKTSLMNAGVLPLLHANGFRKSRAARLFGPMPADFTTDEIWGIKNLYLFNAMVSLVGSDEYDPRQLARLELTDFVSEFILQDRNDEDANQERRHPPEYSLLFFDQVEELFTCYSPRWREREGFFRQIAEAIEAKNAFHSLRVVFVMREEFLSQLEPFTCLLPEELETRYRLEGLGESAAVDAIKGPVERVAADVSFDEGAAEELVKRLRTFRAACAAGELREVESEYVEPMHLQLVCQKLWCHARTHWGKYPHERNRITREFVEKHADVDAALLEFYDDAVHETAIETGVPEWRLRDWCGKLITSEDTRGMLHRGEHRTGDVPNEAADELGMRHLVRTEERFGGLWYELSHDRFIEPIRRSNAAFHRRSKRKNLEETALSVIVLALTDLRLAESSDDEADGAPGTEAAPGERTNRLAVDPVRTLKDSAVRFFLSHLLESDASSEEKYRKLTRLFELQDRLSKKICEHEGPEEDTPDGMQRLVAAVAHDEGIWKPAELLKRTRESILCGVEYVRRSRRHDHGWGYPGNDRSQLWATGHALMALCEASDVLPLPDDAQQIINEGVAWVLGHPEEWYVDRFPPPEERSMYEVGVGLLSLNCALPKADPTLAARAKTPIERSIHSVCKAQNGDGGWDAGIWKEGHPDQKGVFSAVGATSLAIQGLVAWHHVCPAEIESVIQRGLDWLLRTQNGDGSWNGGSCQPGLGLRLSGDPSVNKTCDGVRGLRAGMRLREASGTESEHEKPVARAMAWLRRQERRIRTDSGLNLVGWVADPMSQDQLDSVTTCITLETLVQVDDVFLPLFTANAQWLMDSQDQKSDSPTYGAWPHGDSFRSTLSLIGYYRRIKVSPFFAVPYREAEGGLSA